MAIVWIVTTGNSDIQLTSIPDKWLDLCKEKKSDLKPCLDEFRSKEGIIKQKTGLYTVVARLLGVIFSDKIDEYWNYFKFPLLDGFCKKINEKKIKPDRIIVLLTDQEAIFDISDRSDRDSPYWKDTCTLEPIFEHYFKDKYDVKIESVLLQPEKDQVGLDDWNATLTLVQKKFTSLGVDKNDEVIVSHQAGTPAISSAVQFASLSRFGNKVSFLTSNERTGKASLDPSSSYFELMQIEQAKKFLNNYDYVSVFSVLEDKLERLKEKNPDQTDKIIKLLEVAKLWNLSKFDEFETSIKKLSVDNLLDIEIERFSDWGWWIAYEEAYLAIVRRQQGNIVEAFFHSFRAFEGILAAWGKKEFDGHIDDSKKDKVSILKPSVVEYLQPYFDKHFSLPNKKQSKDIQDLKICMDNTRFIELENEEATNKQKVEKVELNFMTLCKLYRLIHPEYKASFRGLGQVLHTDGISTKRNFIFHQVQGMKESLLMEFWKVDISQLVEKQIEDWEEKLRRFLNFIADEKDFKTWEEASLMARVHKELVKEIEAISTIANN